MVAGGKSIKSNTGNAQIKKQGHTTSGAFGSSPSKQARFGSKPKDLNAK